MAVLNDVVVPPYLKRAGFKPADLGDGGALPKFHSLQFPLGMGMRMTKSNNTLPLTADENAKKKKKIVYSQHSDLVPVFAKDNVDENEVDDEKQKEIDETTRRTKAALEQIVDVRLSSAKTVGKQSSASKFIKYNSGGKERIIRMVGMPVDPFEPPKSKRKRVPTGGSSGSPPVPVMHSPPRPLSVKDQQEWSRIPPCISNWKNPKGYTIPLDKRLASDVRGLEEDVQVNANFAKLSEALYVGEQKAREAVAIRSKVVEEMTVKEKEKKEMELRVLAQKARSERVREETREERDERSRRVKILEERRRERRVESRDRERDISERVALGMGSIGVGGGVMYDERMFNQEKGMGSGFGRDDNAYRIYDESLFTSTQSGGLATLYRPKKDNDDEMYGDADEQLDKINKTKRFKIDRAFTGTKQRSTGEGPVEFEKDEVAGEDLEEDPFGLDQFLTEVKKASAGSMPT